jgi:hypothetical protein
MHESRQSSLLAAIVIGLVICIALGCRGARVPGEDEPEKNASAGPPSPPERKVKEYPPIPFEAELSGREFSIENWDVTHMAIGADDDYEFAVRVGVNVNEDYVGVLYADGWENQSEEKLRIQPGTVSVWVPLRGVWNAYPKGNLLKLNFTYEGIGGIETPARYFKGKLYLKYDPDALKEDAGDSQSKGEIEANP